MKKVFSFVASLLILAGCSQSEVENDFTQKTQENVPVTFGTYVPKGASTRAGAIETPKALADEGGFGLFGYYTQNSTYNSTSSPINYMYNQNVTSSDGTSWTYTPIKYWPNETGTTNIDGNNANATRTDRLSFFAYAPYISATALGTEGITSLPAKVGTGDPKIGYKVAADPKNAVDLMWGVGTGTGYTNVTGGTTTITAGKALTDLIKPTLANQTLTFNFKHALAKLDVNIQGAFDQVAVGGSLDSKTKITVEKIIIKGTGLNTEGTLNLNNGTANEPTWTTSTSGSIDLTVEGDNLNSKIKYEEAKVQTVEGVTATAKTIFKDETTGFMFIPGTPTNIEVEIIYYTTTEDDNLNDGYSQIKNDIKKTITGFQLKAGYKYSLLLALGMESVKVTATVEGWNADSTDHQVDLPINVN